MPFDLGLTDCHSSESSALADLLVPALADLEAPALADVEAPALTDASPAGADEEEPAGLGEAASFDVETPDEAALDGPDLAAAEVASDAEALGTSFGILPPLKRGVRVGPDAGVPTTWAGARTPGLPEELVGFAAAEATDAPRGAWPLSPEGSIRCGGWEGWLPPRGAGKGRGRPSAEFLGGFFVWKMGISR